MRIRGSPLIDGSQHVVPPGFEKASGKHGPFLSSDSTTTMTRKRTRHDMYFRWFLLLGLVGAVICHISYFIYQSEGWNKNDVVRRTSSEMVVLSSFGKVVQQQLIVGPATSWNQTISGTATPKQLNATARVTSTQAVVNRPTLILHIGPGKMATTFLQCVLAQSSDVLRLDDFVFLGKTPTASQCHVNASALWPPSKKSLEYTKDILLVKDSTNSNSNSNDTIQLNPSFAKMMLELYKERKNAILISEHLSVMDSSQIRALADQLTTASVDNNGYTDTQMMMMNWDIRVVIGYRRLYDFLPSRYSQMFKPKWKNQWASPWPGQGEGEAILPFDIIERGNFSTYFVNLEKTSRHLSDKMKLKFNAIFPNVSMINLNELPPASSYGSLGNNSTVGDDHLTYMLCHVIRNAPHMCRAASSGLIGGAFYKNMSSNPSFPMNYDILATAAYSAKLIRTPEKTTRRYVIQAIQHRQEQVLNKTINDFPLLCLENATLNRIIDLSVTMEKRLFPDTINETAHREGFATAVQQRKYCSIDARQLLDQDEDWRLFLSSLQQGETRGET